MPLSSPTTKAWIAAAGGYRAVAKLLSEKETTVHNWMTFDRFPAVQYHALHCLARDLKIDPPPDHLFPAFKAYLTGTQGAI